VVKVLNCACDAELLELRAALLRAHGCEVVSAESPEDALLQMQDSDRFDVLLLCYDMDAQKARCVSQCFRHKYPRGKIIGIAFSYSDSDAIPTDKTISAHDPDAMVEAVTTQWSPVEPIRSS
jgi:CheY-like chemotaxis protein